MQTLPTWLEYSYWLTTERHNMNNIFSWRLICFIWWFIESLAGSWSKFSSTCVQQQLFQVTFYRRECQQGVGEDPAGYCYKIKELFCFKCKNVRVRNTDSTVQKQCKRISTRFALFLVFVCCESLILGSIPSLGCRERTLMLSNSGSFQWTTVVVGS